MPLAAIVSHPFQPIMLISIFIIVLIAWQINQATYALDLSEKMDTGDIDSLSNSEATLHRLSYFYVGGEYVSAQNSAVSFGQMYVEHLVPMKVMQPFPIVVIPGNGRVTIGILDIARRLSYCPSLCL